MKESVAIAKEADAKKGVSPIKSDNSIQRLRDEPERQLGSLRGVIGNIRRDGGTPSVESIATQLSGMPSAQRAPALLALQQTHGNLYVQRVVAGIQAKLKVGQPGDIYEQEADRMADEVMRMPEPGVQRQDDEKRIKSKLLAEQITPLVQRHVEKGGEVTSNLESRIDALRDGGQPLPESVRAFFEPRFRYDFSKVRVHTDSRATELARAVNARAFTIGQNVVFDRGQYAPVTSEGQRLLAHELIHVVQQSQGDGNSQLQLEDRRGEESGGEESGGGLPEAAQEFVINMVSGMSGAITASGLRSSGMLHPRGVRRQFNSGNSRRATEYVRVGAYFGPLGIDYVGLRWRIEWDYDGQSLTNVALEPVDCFGSYLGWNLTYNYSSQQAGRNRQVTSAPRPPLRETTMPAAVLEIRERVEARSGLPVLGGFAGQHVLNNAYTIDGSGNFNFDYRRSTGLENWEVRPFAR
jgi:hypothetical protein